MTTDQPHSIHRARNIELLDPNFVEAMQKAWHRDICWPGCIDNHPEELADNPSYGKCFITSLAAWAAHGFKGNIIPAKTTAPGAQNEEWHFALGFFDPTEHDYPRDEEGRVVIDPTWQQFEPGTGVRPLSEDTQHDRAEFREVMYESLWADETLENRLNLMLAGLRQNGYPLYSAVPGQEGEPMNANEVIDKAKTAFNRIRAPGYIKHFQVPGVRRGGRLVPTAGT